MNDSAHGELWRALIAERLIADEPVRLGGGNLDRDLAAGRSSWRARLPDGSEAKLTAVSAAAAETVDDALAFSRAASELTPRVLFCRRIGTVQVIAEAFVDGTNLEELLQRNPDRVPAAEAGVRRVLDGMTKLARPSDEGGREREWDQWTRRLVALPCWDDAGRRFLTDTLLPLLHKQLTRGPAELRWVHGDLIARNLLINPDGRAWLIDPEYAVETHFPQSELARFLSLSPGIERIASTLVPETQCPAAAGRLLFWLQQVEREVRFNRPEYVGRWLSHRLGEVRRSAEELAGRQLAGCPWPKPADAAAASLATEVDSFVEEARWLVDSPEHAVTIAGWCHPLRTNARLARVEAHVHSQVIATAEPSPRPDVQAHFSGSPAALHSGFRLLLPPIGPDEALDLMAVMQDGSRVIFWRRLAAALPGRGPVHCRYTEWAALLDPDPAPDESAPRAGPRFSVLLPVYNTPPDMLGACLASVQAQHWKNWELCVVDDASPDRSVEVLLDEFSHANRSVRVVRRSENGGIARATNDALAVATGDFVVFLDHDDLLRPHALSELAAHLAAHPEHDAVYSDEDKIDPHGRRVLPLFKPDFSPEYLRGVMYIGHVLCVRRSLALEVGGFDPRFDGVQDYEFMLRVAEHTARIGHVPRVLYHWRQSAGSSSLVGNVKGDMDAKQLAAVQAHLRRTGDPRVAEAIGGHRVRLRAAVGGERRTVDGAAAGCGTAAGDRPNVQPPTSNVQRRTAEPGTVNGGRMTADGGAAGGGTSNVQHATSNVEGKAESAKREGRESEGATGRTPNVEHRTSNIEPPASDSEERSVVTIVRWIEGQHPLVPLAEAARESSAEVLILMDGRVGELSSEAITELAALARLPDSGCVAPVLVSRGGSVWESGCVVCEGELVSVMRGFDPQGDGYSGSLRCNREVDAVSPTCVAIQTELVQRHAAEARDWVDFSERVCGAGRLHRVCAAAVAPSELRRDAGAATEDGGRWTVEAVPTERPTFNVQRSTSKDEERRAQGEGPSAEGAASARKTEDGGRSMAGARAERRTLNVERRTSNGLDAIVTPRQPSRTAGQGSRALVGRRFYNPHFAAVPADYRLAARPGHLPRSLEPLAFAFETTVPKIAPDGWLELRGWCFHLERKPVVVEIAAGDLRCSAPAAASRPDVAGLYPWFTDGGCGFSQRLGLPAGSHVVRVEAVAADGTRTLILEQTVRVSRMVHWNRWRRAAPARRLAFQLAACPAHAPIAVRRELYPFPIAGGVAPGRLSIVTPSFQQARFLGETLASVLNQGLPVEYVVRDGGSIDGSVEVLQRNAARLAHWSSGPDAGQAAAIAEGFRQTTGGPDDLMAWINSDDFYLPGALGYVAEYFRRHPDVDVVYGHRVLVDQNSREIGRWFLPRHDPEVLRLNDFVPQETMFWRRRMWDKVGGIDPSFRFAMDWDLLLRFQAAGARIVRVPYFLACFRIHPAQKTSAQISSVGQAEIDALRRRTFGRDIAADELESDPRLIRYLRTSARIEFLWRTLGWRSR